ncbi:MAG: CapA family protein, partial [Clostridia bacterium]|nr:CapA family protein [Clostridia bacterium]
VFCDTMRYFEKADFSVLNLETLFGNEESYTPLIKSGPNHISKPELYDYLDVIHPTALCLANNHARDFGDECLLNNMKSLREDGFLLVGAGKNIDEAYLPLTFTKDGVSVSIIAVAENEPGYAEDDHAGTAGYNLTRVTHQIRHCRERGELPVIYFHGGNEQNPFPSPAKCDLYRHFVELGAAAVIAMHTHCPQGYEIYNGAPIIYSMGNFFFPKENAPIKAWYYGYMTELDINGENVSCNLSPYTFSSSEHRVLKGKELDGFNKYLAFISAPLRDGKRIRELFNTWSVIRGVRGLLNLLVYRPEMLAGGAKEIKQFKNILNCEAHCELIQNASKLIYDGGVEEAEKLIPFIESLQQMKLPE